MKTYEPRRNNACPNGLHTDYNPALDPTQNECTCPWLIIQSSTPVQHITSWNRRETENVIREMDRGYFDPPGYPKRTGSMFLAPAMQRLIDVAEKEPVAAALSLLAGSGSGLPPFDAIAWDAEDAVMSLRIPTRGWWHLFLGTSNVEAVTNHDDAHAAGANPVLLWADHPDTARETALPKMNAAWHHEQCACDLNDPQQQAGCQRADEFSAAYLPEQVSGDVYAEDILNADGTTAFTAEDLDRAQRAANQAAEAEAARIRKQNAMPLIVTVPAAEIDALRPGNPIYDEAMRQAEDANAGVMFLPEELTFPDNADPGVVANIEVFLDDTSTGVRRERPLPRRVPQVPSEIAFAAYGAPIIGEDGYEIPPLCLNDEHPEGHFSCRRTAGHEDMHRDGSVRWGIL